MKRLQRIIAMVLVIAMFTGLGGPSVRPVAAASVLDPLGALPDWFLDGGDPMDVVARLLPPDPLQGVLPGRPGPEMPAEPDRQASGATASPGAPGSAAVPTPPAPALCPCGPEHVSVATGQLNLPVTDALLTGLGPDIPT